MSGRGRGFTLVELIAVMVVVGILAVAALPRFFDRNVFEARGFLDETRALLRYAQKTAVSQRRTVCVAFAAGGEILAHARAVLLQHGLGHVHGAARGRVGVT